MKAREYRIKSNDDFQQMLGNWLNEKEALEDEKRRLDKLKADSSIDQKEYNMMYEDVMKRYDPNRNVFYSDDLFLAIQNGDVKHIRELRKCGATFSIKDRDGNTPLIHAVQNGELETINALLEETDPDLITAMINAQNNQHESALQIAARLGHAEVVGLLLANGANPDSRDIHNTTPLLCACAAAKNRNPVLIQALLNHGADTNISGKDKRTPLHWAAKHGDVELTKLLLRYGADPGKKDVKGDTPANVASSLLDKAHSAIAALLESLQSLIPGRKVENQLSHIIVEETVKRGVGAKGIFEEVATRKQLTPELLRALVIRAAGHRNDGSAGVSNINIAVVVNNILENNGAEKTKFLKEAGVIEKICRCLTREVQNGSVSSDDARELTVKLMALNNGSSRKQIANYCELGNVQAFLNNAKIMRPQKQAKHEKVKGHINVPAPTNTYYDPDTYNKMQKRHFKLYDTHAGVRGRMEDAAKERGNELRSVVGSRNRGRKK